MKILNVNAILDPVTGGGTAERTIQISRFLNIEKIECCIMTTDLGFTDEILDSLENIRVFAYRCINKRFYIPLVRYSTIKKIVSGVDIVHLMGHWTVLNVLVYIAARALDKPYVVCPAGALSIYGRSRIIKKIYNLLIGKDIIKNANAWIAITRDEISQFIPYGINAEQIIIIPNGINQNDFLNVGVNQFRKKYRINDAPFILFLGRLNFIKGPDLLLDAFCKGKQSWKDWHLVFAGPDGGLLDSLKTTVLQSHLNERVHFIGYVGGEEKSACYHAADLLAIPSRQEAMSIVVLEAGISATPVVLTDQCGFDQVEKISGGKVCQATTDGIYHSLQDILKDTGNLSKMGRQLEDYVKNNYTWSIVIRKYINLYTDLLNTP